jgi:hypothetical protein
MGSAWNLPPERQWDARGRAATAVREVRLQRIDEPRAVSVLVPAQFSLQSAAIAPGTRSAHSGT